VLSPLLLVRSTMSLLAVALAKNLNDWELKPRNYLIKSIILP
jgi:hypothetical protein